jgi:hypothetical protein
MARNGELWPRRLNSSLMMKNIGKPCAGKPQARIVEGREADLPPTLPTVTA